MKYFPRYGRSTTIYENEHLKNLLRNFYRTVQLLLQVKTATECDTQPSSVCGQKCKCIPICGQHRYQCDCHVPGNEMDLCIEFTVIRSLTKSLGCSKATHPGLAFVVIRKIIMFLIVCCTFQAFSSIGHDVAVTSGSQLLVQS